MASKKEYRANIVSDFADRESQNIGIDDHNSPGRYILNKFHRTAKPDKQTVISPAYIQDVTLFLNTPEQTVNAYVISGCPFKSFNRLLLFPFHGFW